uniref:CP n=1 Tax=Cercospora beticola partitivirus 1 TaxID=2971330 RepID=A0A9E7PI42_9VIRU|nr:CP [Cercospora beticola partitivirus 1]
MTKEDRRSSTPESLQCKDYKYSSNRNGAVWNDFKDSFQQKYASQLKPTDEDEKNYLEKLKNYRAKYKDRFNPLHLPFYLKSFENYMLGKLHISHRGNKEYLHALEIYNFDNFSRSRSNSSSSRSDSTTTGSSSDSRHRHYRRSRSRSRSQPKRKKSRSKSPSRSSKTSKYTGANRNRSRSPKSSKHKRTKSRSISPSRSSKSSKETQSRSSTKSAKDRRAKSRSTSPTKNSKQSRTKSSERNSIKTNSKTCKPNGHSTSPGNSKKSVKREVTSSPKKDMNTSKDKLITNSLPAAADQVSAENSTLHLKISMEDFEPSVMNAKFLKKEFKIYFTPCFRKLVFNIRDVLAEYTRFEELKAEFAKVFIYEDQIIVLRSLEAAALLLCGQSLISSVKTIHGASDVCTPLESQTFTILRPLGLLVSQYGEVQSDSGVHLCSVDHHSDIRAIIRIADQFLPNFGEGATDEESANIAKRSWLPTSNTDRRFQWILACRINELMNRKIGYAPPPHTIVKAFQESKKPSWWDSQLPYCLGSDKTTSLLDFLFTKNWTEETFYVNFGLNEDSLLKQLNLDWIDPLPDHLGWNIDADCAIDKVVSTFNEISGCYGTVPLMQQTFPSGHQGSWHQIQQKDKETSDGQIVYFGIGEADSSKVELGIRFPPRALTEPLSSFYKDL